MGEGWGWVGEGVAVGWGGVGWGLNYEMAFTALESSR